MPASANVLAALVVIAANGSALAEAMPGGADPQYLREYRLPAFERVYFAGAGALHIEQGAQTSVTIAANTDVFADLIVESHDGALFIDARRLGSAHAATPELVINLTVAELREVVSVGEAMVTGRNLKVADLTLEGAGAGSFHLTDLRADELIVTGMGATRFSLSGRVDRQVIDLEGSSDYHAEALASQSVEAQVSGAGNILLLVEQLLDVEVAGAARVQYSGSPYVSQRVSGLGWVGRVMETRI